MNMRLSVCSTLFLLAHALPAQSQLLELGRTDHLPPERRHAVDATAGDLDGDGLPDLVLLERGRLVVLRNGGHGTFSTALEVPLSTPAIAGGVSLLDLDGDADLDVVWAAHGADAGILRNDGATFTPLPSPVSGPVREIAVADIDGDGDTDVFAAMSLRPGVSGGVGPQSRLYRNDGGVLVDVTMSSLPSDSKNTATAVFFDADSDGDLDLLCGVAAVYLGPPMDDEVWLNDGFGVFTRSAGALPGDFRNDEDLAVGDVDGDGDIDFVTQGADPVLVFRNDGTGVFTPDPLAVPSFGSIASGGIALADLDADGDLDLAVGVLWPSPRLELLTNDGSGTFTAWRRPADGDAPWRIVTLDADADGTTDLLLANRRSDGVGQRARLLLGNGSGDFVDATEPSLWLAPVSSTTRAGVALVDVDSDGDLDLLRAGDVTTPLRLWLNDGAGPAVDATATRLPPLHGDNFGFGVLDLDGDGPDDVWLWLRPDLTLLVCGPNGSFTALPAGSNPTHAYTLHRVAAADLDGDGLQDLIVRDSSGLHLWQGVAPLTWQPDSRTTFPTPHGTFTLGDFDGDDDVDIAAKAVAHLPSDTIELWANAGDGSFSLHATVTLPLITGFGSLELVDADLDGDLDLFVLASRPELYENDGLGNMTLVPETDFPLPNKPVRRSVVADFDGDGSPDIVGVASAGHGDPALEAWLNDGSGRFTDASATLLRSARTATPAGLAVGDIDGDGDPDLVIDEPSGGARVLANVHRQMRLPWLARRGRPMRIELTGLPGEAVLPLVSLGVAHIDWPPFGSLLVDPATMTVFPTIVLPPDGRVLADFVVPDAPVLVGVRLHAQAFHFGSPGHWGNRASSTATR